MLVCSEIWQMFRLSSAEKSEQLSEQVLYDKYVKIDVLQYETWLAYEPYSQQVISFLFSGRKVSEEILVSEWIWMDNCVRQCCCSVCSFEHLWVVVMRTGRYDHFVKVRTDDVPVAIHIAVHAVVENCRHAEPYGVTVIVGQWPWWFTVIYEVCLRVPPQNAVSDVVDYRCVDVYFTNAPHPVRFQLLYQPEHVLFSVHYLHAQTELNHPFRLLGNLNRK